MNLPIFRVVPRKSKLATPSQPTLVLEQDNWNDYSFQTLYHLSYFGPDAGGLYEETLIGPVKILRAGQTPVDGIQIQTDFDRLGPNFCSVGSSLDYYERIAALGELGVAILEALRDVVHKPELIDQFENEAGWATSLFRDQGDSGEQFRYLATGIMVGHYSKAPADQQPFDFHMAGWAQPVSVDTTSGGSGFPWHESVLPERVNVIVGRNGSGKSTLLARLARVAYGSTTERAGPILKRLGQISPPDVGFPRVITVAFSPFDSFILPGLGTRDAEQIAKDVQRGVGRFSFIGLRDFAAEIDLSKQGGAGSAPGNDGLGDDRVQQTRLKSAAQLAEEFAGFHVKVHASVKRKAVLLEALKKLENGFLDDEWGAIADQFADARAWFNHRSTGHKIAALAIYGLVASLQPRSLVLFDEPETHLHPPLLSAMMHALRVTLKHYESTAIVATHSPVVVQETMAKHVHVVRREGGTIAVQPLAAETFGESIGLITAQVFGMESNATDFHGVLDRLMALRSDIAGIESRFLGGVMSHQARAYVLSKLASSEKQ